ncbi:copine-9-like [Contarinia nasturtii]|uniref:copine-9-like n=1 Tax=Contarinia nasturtii TaxID=265458 RepID=UPI0012D41F40|nr:copine-9-like [Contarinia nasturtii]
MPLKPWSTNTAYAKTVTNEMLAPFLPSSLPTSQVELTLSCRNLINTDILSKSDPFCIVLMREPWQDQYYEISRTETIDDTLNPQWVKKVLVDYNFETIQKIRFEVLEKDVQSDDFLGFYETTLSDLVSFSGRQFIGKLGGLDKECGEIIIVTEEVMSCRQVAELHFEAKDLPKMSPIFRNDPFLAISRSNEDGSYSVVARTDPCRSTQNPVWKPMEIRLATLCNGDFDRSIRIDCFDNRMNGNHKIIGTCYTSLRSLEKSDSPMPLINEEKQKTDPELGAAGTLKIVKINITEETTFLDFVRSGTQMHFAVAIDFTASNGRHSNPNSLHYLNPEHLNNYEVAICGVGEIIEYYDASKLFPAFGFGAKLPPNGKLSHLFPLNGTPSYPFCDGVAEILKQYRIRLKNVELFGPTNFAPVINTTVTIARQFQNGRHYFVLLIITDGVISDMKLTKRAIINASSLPISIIIVGVGDAVFDKMDELDSDDVRLTVKGSYAERDIVQFVPLNKFLAKNGESIKSKSDLAKEVLAEIPEQITSYMKSRGFKPKLPEKAAATASAAETLPNDASVIQPTAPMLT